MDKKIIILTGPTASGKTNASIALAKKYNTEIIFADSIIIYKDLDIVSAKPTIKEQDGIKHHLIDILEPTQNFSAGDFVLLSKKIIEDIFKQDKNVIICGGTWFYIKSLLDEKNLPECPINPELRQELSLLNNNTLWEKLNKLDSKRASQIHPNNKDKVIRSIEMCLSLGCPISEYQRKETENYNTKWYMFDYDRETLYKRINKRVDIMLEMGLFEEWKKNKEKYCYCDILKNTIGYKEFFDLEDGLYDNFDIAVEKIKQHTRNFAKRQLTYFKSNQKINLIKNYDEIIKDLEND